jgi:hypothetical protein
MGAYKYCFPFQNTLLHELLNLIRAKAVEWFDKISDIYLKGVGLHL